MRNVMRSIHERFWPKVIAIEESKDLDAIKIEELVRSLQTYELSLPQLKNNKLFSLKTVREANCDTIDDNKLKDDDLAYLARKFKNFLKNSKRSPYKFKGESSTSRNNKRERSGARYICKKFVRCHECLVLVMLNLSVQVYKKP